MIVRCSKFFLTFPNRSIFFLTSYQFVCNHLKCKQSLIPLILIFILGVSIQCTLLAGHTAYPKRDFPILLFGLSGHISCGTSTEEMITCPDQVMALSQVYISVAPHQRIRGEGISRRAASALSSIALLSSQY